VTGPLQPTAAELTKNPPTAIRHQPGTHVSRAIGPSSHTAVTLLQRYLSLRSVHFAWRQISPVITRI
jgi:hypothetical protein